MKVKFTGGKELEARIKALGNKALARRVAERALKRAAEPIRDKAKELAPKDERNLEQSISIGRAIKAFQRTSSGDIVRTFVGIDESKDARLHIYASIDEFGTDSHPAQPYMRPAWEAEKMTAFNLLRTTLDEEITKAAARQARKASR